MLKKNNFSRIVYILVFAIPILLLVIHMIVSGCYPFGDNTILVADGNIQYISFMKLLIDKLKNGESILFDWHSGMGMEFYQNFWYYLGSPINIIAVIVGQWDLELGVVLTMLIQVGMCGVTMLYYLIHTRKNNVNVKNNPVICGVISLAYPLCNYMLAYQYNYIWLVSLIMAPLVMLGVERLTEERNPRLYVISMVIVFITNFYFAWFICILSFVWFVDSIRMRKGKTVKQIASYLFFSISSALAACFVLLPCYMASMGLKYATTGDGYFTLKKFGSILDFLSGFLWGTSIDVKGAYAFTNNNYIGIVSAVLVVLFLSVNDISLSKRIRRLVIVFVFSFFQNWSLGIYIFHGFSFPNMFFSRNMFILELILIVTAYETIVHIQSINKKMSVVCLAVMTVILIVLLLHNGEGLNVESCIVNIILFIICVLPIILYLRGILSRKLLVTGILVILMLELILNGFYVSRKNYEQSKDYIMASDEWSEKYEEIELEAGERKTAWMSSQNSISYSDTNAYSSILSSGVLAWNRSLGLAFQGNGRSYAYRGSTPVTAMLSNVRSVLTDNTMLYGGYEAQEEHSFYHRYKQQEDHYYVCDTEYLVGLGYMVPENIVNWNLYGNPFEVQNNLTQNVLGIGNVFDRLDVDRTAIDSSGCDIIDYDGYSISYCNTMYEKTSYAYTVYQFEVPENSHIYMCVRDERQAFSYVYIDSEPVLYDEQYPAIMEMLDLGELKTGQIVTVLIYNNSSYGENGVTDIMLYKYSEEVMSDVVDSLGKAKYIIESFDETNVEGIITATQDGVMYTSIPYYKGMSAYVDGKREEIITIGGAMCGVRIPQGTHRITFCYVPYGLRTGLVLSVLGILLLFVSIRIYGKKQQ